MSNGQNNPNQGNQKHGREDQKHTQKQRHNVTPQIVTGQKQQTGGGTGTGERGQPGSGASNPPTEK